MGDMGTGEIMEIRNTDNKIAHYELFCELHQELENVDRDTYIEWCRDNAEAAKFGMKAVYECGKESV